MISRRNDLRIASLELDKQISANNRDRVERVLDDAINSCDTEKTINERRILDENNTFEERIKLLERTTELTNKSFNDQIELAEGYTNERLNLNELIAIDDQKEVVRRLRQADLDDVTFGRVLEIIRERKIATQDLIELEQDLSSQIEERSKTEIEASNLLQQFRLERDIREANGIDEREDKEIKSSKFRFGVLLDNEKLLSDERILLEEQLQDEISNIRNKADEDRLKEEEEALNKSKEAREKQFQEIKKLAEDLTSNIGEELEKQTQEEIDATDKNIDNTEKEIERQQSLADRGADNELARQEEFLNESQLKRKELLERQQKEQAIIKSAEIFLAAYEARLNDDPNTAFQKAFGDTAKGLAGAKAAEGLVGAFKDGVENLDGKGTGTSDSNLAWLSKGESVITEKGTRNNKGLATAINNDTVSDWFNNSEYAVNVRGDLFSQNNDDKLVKEIRNLSKDIKNIPTSDINGDKVGNIIQTIRVGGNKRRITHKINRVQ